MNVILGMGRIEFYTTESGLVGFLDKEGRKLDFSLLSNVLLEQTRVYSQSLTPERRTLHLSSTYASTKYVPASKHSDDRSPTIVSRVSPKLKN